MPGEERRGGGAKGERSLGGPVEARRPPGERESGRGGGAGGLQRPRRAVAAPAVLQPAGRPLSPLRRSRPVCGSPAGLGAARVRRAWAAMPFWKRTVEPRRLLPSAALAPRLAALPLARLHDVCGAAALALLRQLADLCGHSAALLGELEGRLLQLARRARRLRGRLRRARRLLRPGAAREEAPAPSSGQQRRPEPGRCWLALRTAPPPPPPPPRAEMGNSPPGMLGKAPRSKRPPRTAAVAPSSTSSSSAALGQPATATSNVDLEVKKPTPPKLLWHQPVNIFLARPVGVEELHHEAELNLQSLLQEEYEEPYSDPRISGQTFRYASPLSADRPLDCSPRPPRSKRLEFVFMPANQQVRESETTTLGVRALEPSFSLPATPDKHTAWSRAGPLPSLEEKRLHQPCPTQANIVPINVSGQPFARHASTRHSLFNTETAMNPKSLLRRRRTVIGFPHLSLRDPGNSNGPILNPPATIAESVSCNFVPDVANGRSSVHPVRSPHPRPQLRKTFSDLGGALQGRCCQMPAGHPEKQRVMYASPSCNGPKEDSAFSPAWSAASFGYVSPSMSHSELTGGSTTPSSPCAPGATPESERPASFFIGKDSVVGNNGSGSFCASPKSLVDAQGGSRGEARETKVHLVPSPGEEECPRVERERMSCKFRERSLSVPTDTASLCSVDIGGSETCGLSYPSASSEGSTSTDNVSLAVDPDAQTRQRRQRMKSISLKKAKKKPCPPTRSVSLIKDGQVTKGGSDGEAAAPDQRPKSLCLLSEMQVQEDTNGEVENMPYTPQWYLAEWNSSDPYCSLSGSSTTTGTTVIDLSKARGSSESLPSPSISRATTPSHLSTEVNLKISSPGRFAGVMSPSSGYSSQSETPTPTIPGSTVLGHAPHHSGRARPLVPERKSSLPPASPMERSPKSRMSFDLPFAPPTHLDLSGLKISKGKAKVSRHHSDCTFGVKLGPKLSPVQPVMPMVTQLDLQSVRLRSISRSETEDNLDSPEPMEEHGKKIRPPVAEKPPLSRRPPMLLHKTPPVQEESPVSSPTSPLTPQGPNPTENVYMVARKPEHRWDTEAWSPIELASSSAVLSPTQGSSGTFFTASRRLSLESLEEEEELKQKLPTERTPGGENRKTKVPPPVPKKPSVLYLPLAPSPLHQGTPLKDPRLATSPVITLDENYAYSELPTCKLPSPVGSETNMSPMTAEEPWGEVSGNFVDLRTEDKGFVSDKTATSITEEDDDVFVTSRTTEDLFTVIHRSKRKLLGWKEPSDAFGNRNSQVSSKNPGGPFSNDCSPTGSIRTSSRNEDFKALLQKKGGKGASGTRTSAAELLKTTNPLARRVMTEFAVEGTIPSPKATP
uniref:NHS-like protein 2 n=1 Tax=Euleptes europaea TaxID=460621 RepID=UPI0025413BA0|nr:NHS-like protein 2 [Euleptes europaea]